MCLFFAHICAMHHVMSISVWCICNQSSKDASSACLNNCKNSNSSSTYCCAWTSTALNFACFLFFTSFSSVFFHCWFSSIYLLNILYVNVNANAFSSLTQKFHNLYKYGITFCVYMFFSRKREKKRHHIEHVNVKSGKMVVFSSSIFVHHHLIKINILFMQFVGLFKENLSGGIWCRQSINAQLKVKWTG